MLYRFGYWGVVYDWGCWFVGVGVVVFWYVVVGVCWGFVVFLC